MNVKIDGKDLRDVLEGSFYDLGESATRGVLDAVKSIVTNCNFGDIVEKYTLDLMVGIDKAVEKRNSDIVASKGEKKGFKTELWSRGQVLDLLNKKGQM